MMVNDQEEFDQVAGVCWLATGEMESLAMYVSSPQLLFLPSACHADRSDPLRQGFPQQMPFSQTYPMCCINIRNFVDQFYQFTDGVAQHHVDIDEVLRKASGLLHTQRTLELTWSSRWMACCRTTSRRR